jgi:hypothetical protein
MLAHFADSARDSSQGLLDYPFEQLRLQSPHRLNFVTSEKGPFWVVYYA